MNVVSIVTISYNQGEFLEACIDSVLSQDYPAIEYIVVDAGSTDGSREIIEKYRDRITKIIFESDRGPSDGLNKGFMAASGQIYGFLNSDDFLLPGAIRKICDAFAQRPMVDVISGNAYIVDRSGCKSRPFFSKRYSLLLRSYRATVLAQQSTYFKAACFHEAGGFNVHNKVAWDGELWIDMAMVGARFDRIPDFISAFRIYEESITGSGRESVAYQNYLQLMFRKIRGREENNLDRLIGYMMRIISAVAHPIATMQRLRLGPVVRR